MKFEKPEISGLIVLFIGVGLLAFTFLNAYWFLVEDITIVASQDLVAAFGQALAPLVATCIHVMYLGIMGWIGSLLTLRGIPLLTHPKTVTAVPQQAQPLQAPIPTSAPKEAAKKEQKEKPKQEKVEKPQPPAKPEPKPAKEEPKKEEPEKKPEPEITIEVRTPEEIAVPVSPQQSPEAEKPSSTP